MIMSQIVAYVEYNAQDLMGESSVCTEKL
uniref:Uncharacterized protein n=1 Tax=Rhizophora mucronata TaxID=61149 RepID=A0A2P2Q0S8_RHIMU